MSSSTGLDLTDPETFRSADYLSAWRAARLAHPVVRLDSPRHGPYWSVTGHELARQVLEDPHTFTSSKGMRIGGKTAAVAAAADRMLVVADGAAHARVRAAHAPWFTAQNVNMIAAVLYRRLTALVADMATGEPVDVVQRLADAAPTCVMGEMLRTDPEETDRLSQLVRASFDETPQPDDASSRLSHAAASAEVFSFFMDLLRSRKAEPGDDVVSVLMESSGRERPLSTEEVLLNCDGLVNGGLGTSRHAVSGAVLAFALHPDQWRRVREDRSLLRPAVEEVLRWASPPMHVMRTAVADVRLGGADIASGDRVVLWIPSCNRDETVFRDPDAFRVDRRPNPHLSLGAGPHYCIGASIGRMEIRVLLQVLLDRVDQMEIRGTPERTASAFLNGVDRLEVSLTPVEQS